MQQKYLYPIEVQLCFNIPVIDFADRGVPGGYSSLPHPSPALQRLHGCCCCTFNHSFINTDGVHSVISAAALFAWLTACIPFPRSKLQKAKL